MMRTTFAIGEPAAVSRCSLLAACTKLAVVFDETMESVSEIGGVHRVHVYAVRNDSSHLYSTIFSFPLAISCRIMDRLGKTVTGVDAELYINEETSEALAAVYGASGEEFRGDIDTVVKTLSAAILKQLQRQCNPVSG